MEIWEKAVEALQTRIKPYDFTHWIRPISVASFDDEQGRILLRVPDDSHGRWLEEHFLQAISETLEQLTETSYEVKFEVQQQSLDLITQHPGPQSEPPTEREHTRRCPNLVRRYRFDSFVDGPNSRFALTAAKAVSEQPGHRYNPLLIYGGVGLGKTHLLHAIGHAAWEQDPSIRVRYVSSETYVNDLITAIRTHGMDAFRANYRDQCDVLLIDDIQFIAGKGRTQEEFFHMFNTLHAANKQLVMTCDQMPNAIPELEERLKSRLQWGLIADIKPPCFETRVAIVEGKAIEDGISLPSSVAMFLARHIDRNVRELEGALMRLEAHAKLLKSPIGLDMARDILGDIITPQQHQTSATEIIRAVCQAFEVSPSDLKGPRRHRHVTTPRQVAMYLIRELASASLPHIGSQFGGRDHTTVLNAIKRTNDVQKVNPLLRQRIDAIRTQLGS